MHLGPQSFTELIVQRQDQPTGTVSTIVRCEGRLEPAEERDRVADTLPVENQIETLAWMNALMQRYLDQRIELVVLSEDDRIECVPHRPRLADQAVVVPGA